jgi:hypothetical protein
MDIVYGREPGTSKDDIGRMSSGVRRVKLY